ncbi:HAMP domain-containing protein [Desulfonema magnum]|uniref:HAMP domain-containing protein n=1 Tax=Desulfonema magnum TaxID=45655 RepID=A0A975GRB8_9BACT|nr:HAMP domain-containing protein [Desulfonema magnum]QTA90777.1 HAMP domain-containing protein [Desulfonema magnum]
MKSSSKYYSLQRTMIIYFLLIGFASLLVGIEFIVETHGSDLKEELLSNFEMYSKGEIGTDSLFAPIDKLRSKAILMIFIILCVMIIVLTMFIKNITGPLQHMIEISKEISRGDLSYTVAVRSNNELSELGNVINEMSSNLQEIILLSKNLCSSGDKFVENTSAILNDKKTLAVEDIENLKEKTDYLKTELEMLSEVIEYFNFYTIKNDT